MAFSFRTTVKGACVLEKKHIAAGPNNGYIDISDLSIEGGEGPNTKSRIGDASAKIGEVTKVMVSVNLTNCINF